MQTLCRHATPLGPVLLTAGEAGLTGLWFADQARAPLPPGALPPEGDSPALAQARRWLDEYFAGRQPGFMPPLHLAGSEFQRAVWDILRAIPYGCTVTYGDIARRLAPQSPTGRMSAQAVGGAVGRNPVSILVPCHRVVGAAGRLTGYAGGLERKRWLLEWEGAHVALSGPAGHLLFRSAGPEGEGGGFDSPSLPPLDTLPSPKRPGDVPLDPNAEGRSGRLAEKALYRASDVLRIAFSGRHPPCAPIVYARPSGAPAQRSQRNHD